MNKTIINKSLACAMVLAAALTLPAEPGGVCRPRRAA